MANFNFQQIASAWIVKNNSQGVINSLVQAGVIANTATGNTLTAQQLTDALYSYYLKNGSNAFANLLRTIPVNENLSEAEIAVLENASIDLRKVLNISPNASMDSGLPTTQDFKSSVKDFWDLLVGGSQTVVAPVVTTTTKMSPLSIGLIIGGVAVLGILAWVIVKQ